MYFKKCSLQIEVTVRIHKTIYFRLSNGGESLFQASDDEEMSQWVNAINTVADPAAGAGSGRAQTLPAGERRPGEEPKKRSFFTLKKKQFCSKPFTL